MRIVIDKDYEKLSTFWKDNGLETEVSREMPDNLVRSWSICDADGKVLAAAAVEKREGNFVVSDLAVDVDSRGKGYAIALMKVAEAEIKTSHGKEAWLVGKVPEFYGKIGWETVAREDAPDISRCFSCEDFQVSCFPQIMKKVFL